MYDVVMDMSVILSLHMFCYVKLIHIAQNQHPITESKIYSTMLFLTIITLPHYLFHHEDEVSMVNIQISEVTGGRC